MAAGVDPQLIADLHRQARSAPRGSSLRIACVQLLTSIVRSAFAPVSKVIAPSSNQPSAKPERSSLTVEDPVVGDRLDRGHAREAIVGLEDRGAVRGLGTDRGVVGRLARMRSCPPRSPRRCGPRSGPSPSLPWSGPGRTRLRSPPDPGPAPAAENREPAVVVAEIGPAVGAEQPRACSARAAGTGPAARRGSSPRGVRRVSPSVPRRSRTSPWPSGSCQLTNEIAISAPSNRPARTSSSHDAALGEHPTAMSQKSSAPQTPQSVP